MFDYLNSITEKVLYSAVRNAFDSIFVNFEREQLSVSLTRGCFEIRNLNIKPELFDGIPFPIRLCDALVGKARIEISWTKFYSGGFLTIILQDIYIIFNIIDIKEWDVEMCEKSWSNLKSKLLQQDEVWMFLKSQFASSLIRRIGYYFGSKVQIEIDNVNLRIEDYTNVQPFAIGAIIRKITTQDCDEFWFPTNMNNSKSNTRGIFNTFRISSSLNENISILGVNNEMNGSQLKSLISPELSSKNKSREKLNTDDILNIILECNDCLKQEESNSLNQRTFWKRLKDNSPWNWYWNKQSRNDLFEDSIHENLDFRVIYPYPNGAGVPISIIDKWIYLKEQDEIKLLKNNRIITNDGLRKGDFFLKSFIFSDFSVYIDNIDIELSRIASNSCRWTCLESQSMYTGQQNVIERLTQLNALSEEIRLSMNCIIYPLTFELRLRLVPSILRYEDQKFVSALSDRVYLESKDKEDSILPLITVYLIIDSFMLNIQDIQLQNILRFIDYGVFLYGDFVAGTYPKDYKNIPDGETKAIYRNAWFNFLIGEIPYDDPIKSEIEEKYNVYALLKLRNEVLKCLSFVIHQTLMRTLLKSYDKSDESNVMNNSRNMENNTNEELKIKDKAIQIIWNSIVVGHNEYYTGSLNFVENSVNQKNNTSHYCCNISSREDLKKDYLNLNSNMINEIVNQTKLILNSDTLPIHISSHDIYSELFSEKDSLDNPSFHTSPFTFIVSIQNLGMSYSVSSYKSSSDEDSLNNTNHSGRNTLKLSCMDTYLQYKAYMKSEKSKISLAFENLYLIFEDNFIGDCPNNSICLIRFGPEIDIDTLDKTSKQFHPLLHRYSIYTGTSLCNKRPYTISGCILKHNNKLLNNEFDQSDNLLFFRNHTLKSHHCSGGLWLVIKMNNSHSRNTPKISFNGQTYGDVCVYASFDIIYQFIFPIISQINNQKRSYYFNKASRNIWKIVNKGQILVNKFLTINNEDNNSHIYLNVQSYAKPLIYIPNSGYFKRNENINYYDAPNSQLSKLHSESSSICINLGNVFIETKYTTQNSELNQNNFENIRDHEYIYIDCITCKVDNLAIYYVPDLRFKDLCIVCKSPNIKYNKSMNEFISDSYGKLRYILSPQFWSFTLERYIKILNKTSKNILNSEIQVNSVEFRTFKSSEDGDNYRESGKKLYNEDVNHYEYSEDCLQAEESNFNNILGLSEDLALMYLIRDSEYIYHINFYLIPENNSSLEFCLLDQDIHYISEMAENLIFFTNQLYSVKSRDTEITITKELLEKTLATPYLSLESENLSLDINKKDNKVNSDGEMIINTNDFNKSLDSRDTFLRCDDILDEISVTSNSLIYSNIHTNNRQIGFKCCIPKITFTVKSTEEYQKRFQHTDNDQLLFLQIEIINSQFFAKFNDLIYSTIYILINSICISGGIISDQYPLFINPIISHTVSPLCKINISTYPENKPHKKDSQCVNSSSNIGHQTLEIQNSKNLEAISTYKSTYFNENQTYRSYSETIMKVEIYSPKILIFWELYGAILNLVMTLYIRSFSKLYNYSKLNLDVDRKNSGNLEKIDHLECPTDLKYSKSINSGEFSSTSISKFYLNLRDLKFIIPCSLPEPVKIFAYNYSSSSKLQTTTKLDILGSPLFHIKLSLNYKFESECYESNNTLNSKIYNNNSNIEIFKMSIKFAKPVIPSDLMEQLINISKNLNQIKGRDVNLNEDNFPLLDDYVAIPMIKSLFLHKLDNKSLANTIYETSNIVNLSLWRFTLETLIDIPIVLPSFRVKVNLKQSSYYLDGYIEDSTMVLYIFVESLDIRVNVKSLIYLTQIGNMYSKYISGNLIKNTKYDNPDIISNSDGASYNSTNSLLHLFPSLYMQIKMNLKKFIAQWETEKMILHYIPSTIKSIKNGIHLEIFSIQGGIYVNESAPSLQFITNIYPYFKDLTDILNNQNFLNQSIIKDSPLIISSFTVGSFPRLPILPRDTNTVCSLVFQVKRFFISIFNNQLMYYNNLIEPFDILFKVVGDSSQINEKAIEERSQAEELNSKEANRIPLEDYITHFRNKDPIKTENKLENELSENLSYIEEVSDDEVMSEETHNLKDIHLEQYNTCKLKNILYEDKQSVQDNNSTERNRANFGDTTESLENILTHESNRNKQCKEMIKSNNFVKGQICISWINVTICPSYISYGLSCMDNFFDSLSIYSSKLSNLNDSNKALLACYLTKDNINNNLLQDTTETNIRYNTNSIFTNSSMLNSSERTFYPISADIESQNNSLYSFKTIFDSNNVSSTFIYNDTGQTIALLIPFWTNNALLKGKGIQSNLFNSKSFMSSKTKESGAKEVKLAHQQQHKANVEPYSKEIQLEFNTTPGQLPTLPTSSKTLKNSLYNEFIDPKVLSDKAQGINVVSLKFSMSNSLDTLNSNNSVLSYISLKKEDCNVYYVWKYIQPYKKISVDRGPNGELYPIMLRIRLLDDVFDCCNIVMDKINTDVTYLDLEYGDPFKIALMIKTSMLNNQSFMVTISSRIFISNNSSKSLRILPDPSLVKQYTDMSFYTPPINSETIPIPKLRSLKNTLRFGIPIEQDNLNYSDNSNNKEPKSNFLFSLISEYIPQLNLDTHDLPVNNWDFEELTADMFTLTINPGKFICLPLWMCIPLIKRSNIQKVGNYKDNNLIYPPVKVILESSWIYKRDVYFTSNSVNLRVFKTFTNEIGNNPKTITNGMQVSSVYLSYLNIYELTSQYLQDILPTNSYCRLLSSKSDNQNFASKILDLSEPSSINEVTNSVYSQINSEGKHEAIDEDTDQKTSHISSSRIYISSSVYGFSIPDNMDTSPIIFVVRFEPPLTLTNNLLYPVYIDLMRSKALDTLIPINRGDINDIASEIMQLSGIKSDIVLATNQTLSLESIPSQLSIFLLDVTLNKFYGFYTSSHIPISYSSSVKKVHSEVSIPLKLHGGYKISQENSNKVEKIPHSSAIIMNEFLPHSTSINLFTESNPNHFISNDYTLRQWPNYITIPNSNSSDNMAASNNGLKLTYKNQEFDSYTGTVENGESIAPWFGYQCFSYNTCKVSMSLYSPLWVNNRQGTPIYLLQKSHLAFKYRLGLNECRMLPSQNGKSEIAFALTPELAKRCRSNYFHVERANMVGYVTIPSSNKKGLKVLQGTSDTNLLKNNLNNNEPFNKIFGTGTPGLILGYSITSIATVSSYITSFMINIYDRYTISNYHSVPVWIHQIGKMNPWLLIPPHVSWPFHPVLNNRDHPQIEISFVDPALLRKYRSNFKMNLSQIPYKTLPMEIKDVYDVQFRLIDKICLTDLNTYIRSHSNVDDGNSTELSDKLCLSFCSPQKKQDNKTENFKISEYTEQNFNDNLSIGYWKKPNLSCYGGKVCSYILSSISVFSVHSSSAYHINLYPPQTPDFRLVNETPNRIYFKQKETNYWNTLEAHSNIDYAFLDPFGHHFLEICIGIKTKLTKATLKLKKKVKKLQSEIFSRHASENIPMNEDMNRSKSSKVLQNLLRKTFQEDSTQGQNFCNEATNDDTIVWYRFPTPLDLNDVQSHSKLYIPGLKSVIYAVLIVESGTRVINLSLDGSLYRRRKAETNHNQSSIYSIQSFGKSGLRYIGSKFRQTIGIIDKFESLASDWKSSEKLEMDLLSSEKSTNKFFLETPYETAVSQTTFSTNTRIYPCTNMNESLIPSYRKESVCFDLSLSIEGFGVSFITMMSEEIVYLAFQKVDSSIFRYPSNMDYIHITFRICEFQMDNHIDGSSDTTLIRKVTPEEFLRLKSSSRDNDRSKTHIEETDNDYEGLDSLQYMMSVGFSIIGNGSNRKEDLHCLYYKLSRMLGNSFKDKESKLSTSYFLDIRCCFVSDMNLSNNSYGYNGVLEIPYFYVWIFPLSIHLEIDAMREIVLIMESVINRLFSFSDQSEEQLNNINQTSTVVENMKNSSRYMYIQVLIVNPIQILCSTSKSTWNVFTLNSNNPFNTHIRNDTFSATNKFGIGSMSIKSSANLKGVDVIQNISSFNISQQAVSNPNYSSNNGTTFILGLIQLITTMPFSSVPIEFKGIISESFFVNSEKMSMQFFNIYKQQVFSHIGRILGSIDLLGNPIDIYILLKEGILASKNHFKLYKAAFELKKTIDSSKNSDHSDIFNETEYDKTREFLLKSKATFMIKLILFCIKEIFIGINTLFGTGIAAACQVIVRITATLIHLMEIVYLFDQDELMSIWSGTPLYLNRHIADYPKDLINGILTGLKRSIIIILGTFINLWLLPAKMYHNSGLLGFIFGIFLALIRILPSGFAIFLSIIYGITSGTVQSLRTKTLVHHIRPLRVISKNKPIQPYFIPRNISSITLKSAGLISDLRYVDVITYFSTTNTLKEKETMTFENLFGQNNATKQFLLYKILRNESEVGINISNGLIVMTKAITLFKDGDMVWTIPISQIDTVTVIHIIKCKSRQDDSYFQIKKRSIFSKSYFSYFNRISGDPDSICTSQDKNDSFGEKSVINPHVITQLDSTINGILTGIYEFEIQLKQSPNHDHMLYSSKKVTRRLLIPIPSSILETRKLHNIHINVKSSEIMEDTGNKFKLNRNTNSITEKTSLNSLHLASTRYYPEKLSFRIEGESRALSLFSLLISLINPK
ncbi:hypothetical protein cand_034760 [Cryptosporidium andersoni]|uniref:Chorein N-terminal domain-containing protein n=1 Tax=Cryptosporidium andersoni TaxID=117008 RepID=A0A1J4MXJ5_9CRYT|nr:hypothetical protein cand_034760 [Cryptosporidium andersoni]